MPARSWSTPEAELAHLERIQMAFPMAIRIRRKIQALRQVVARQQERRRQQLRGRILRALGGVSTDTLARVARELEEAS
jgi:hypothetical protein